MMSFDARGSGSVAVCGGLVISASATDVVLVDCFGLVLVKAALKLEIMAEAFFVAITDRLG
jgi:hypothetical protein